MLEGLVKAGAFDKLNGSRAQTFLAIEAALDFGSKIKTAIDAHTDSLFGGQDEAFDVSEPEFENINPWSPKDKLAKEREVLGFYLSGHPLAKFETEYYSFATVRFGEPETFAVDKLVIGIGVITEIRTKIDKSGRTMAFFKLDDFSGSCECLMFSKVYKEFGDCIQEESTVLVKGKLESSGDAVKLHVDEAIPLEDAKSTMAKKL